MPKTLPGARTSSSQDHYFLTTASIGCEQAKFIDLCDLGAAFFVLKRLKELGIEVANDSFRTFFEPLPPHTQTFLELGERYDEVTQPNHKLNITHVKMDRLPCHDVNTLAQRLSDFENGIELKRQIESLNQDIAGYCWREHGDERGLTYCFIKTDCLGAPQCSVLPI